MNLFRDGRPMYRDRDGSPITLERWCELREADYIVVAKTLTPVGEVSTVWLGLDHAMLDGPPLIFETMVFEVEAKTVPFAGQEIEVHEAIGDCRRYTTEEEALRGHLEVVERLGGPILVSGGLPVEGSE